MENEYKVENAEVVETEKPAPKKKNVASIILGAVSLESGICATFLGWIPFLSYIGVVCAITGIITGVISKKLDASVKLTKFGNIFSIIGAAVSVVFSILWTVGLVIMLTELL